jgi:type IX secretion system PorP/SprF family membrane protein
MKRILLAFLILSLSAANNFLFAQDIPLFSQKLTNSFIFNPALAGHTFGSITYSFKQNYNKVKDAPQNHFLSFHAPISNNRFGVGASVYQEDVTFLRNTYISSAFAYHIPITKLTSLSFGLSGEYNSFGINGDPDPGLLDEDLQSYRNGIKQYDFSFGTHFQNRFVKIGIASNRLSTTWIKDQDKAVLSNYFSGFAQGLIPIRGAEDLLEPYIGYRKLSDINSIMDVGLYYTYSNKITLGAALRSGKVLSGTLALRPSKYLMFGYSREMITGNVGGFTGAANEFTIRYDFSDPTYKERFSSDYKSSVAYRRKTLSGPARKPGARSPKQVAKNQKKLAPYSPNKRYQNTKKLSIKTKAGKKSKFSAKKRKKTGGKRRPPRRR